MRINHQWTRMRTQVSVHLHQNDLDELFPLLLRILAICIFCFHLIHGTYFLLYSIEGIIHKPMLRKSTLIQTMKVPVESPPYRKVRALRLYDTPATPKTLFKKAIIETPAQNRFIRKPMANTFPPHTPNNRPLAYPMNKSLEPMSANINPFSPSSINRNNFVAYFFLFTFSPHPPHAMMDFIVIFLWLICRFSSK